MNDLQELLDHYFSLGVAEGKEGRDHDTPDGEAQATRDLIDQKIQRLQRELVGMQTLESAQPDFVVALRERYIPAAISGDVPDIALAISSYMKMDGYRVYRTLCHAQGGEA